MESTWPGSAKAAVTLSFDDGHAATYDSTVSALHLRGLGGTYHIVTRLVGGKFQKLKTADWSQWREAALLGHEIGSHSSFHTPLAGYSSDVRRFLTNFQVVPDRYTYVRQVLATICALQKWKTNGSPVSYEQRLSDELDDLIGSRQCIDQMIGSQLAESFSYPAGRYNLIAQQAVASAGFRSARTLDLGLNDKSGSMFSLRGVSLGPRIGVGDLQYWIERACSTRTWLIVVFHLVAKENPEGYPYFCSYSDFQRLLDLLKAQPVWIATQQQVVNYLSMGGRR